MTVFCWNLNPSNPLPSLPLPHLDTSSQPVCCCLFGVSWSLLVKLPSKPATAVLQNMQCLATLKVEAIAAAELCLAD